MNRLVFSFILLVVSLHTPIIQLSIADVGSSHGTVCQPANLNQALNLGLGWSQRGVANNAPLGGGSFFVTCPITTEDSNTLQIEIETQQRVPAAKTPSCFLFRQEIDDRNPPIIVNLPPTSVGNKGTISHLVAILEFRPNQKETANVVCAMHPQTVLKALYFQDFF